MGDFRQRYDLNSTSKSIGEAALGLAILTVQLVFSGDDWFPVRRDVIRLSIAKN